MENILDTDAVADVDAVPEGEQNTDVDVDDHPLHPLQSILGLTEIVRTGAKNVITLPTEKIRMQPLRI